MSEKVSVDPDLVMHILYGTSSGQRYTQDTPVLPEVWITLAGKPKEPVRTLIVPWGENQAHLVAQELYYRIDEYRELSNTTKVKKSPNVSDIPGVVAADLYLDELVNVILPLTRWWDTHHLKALVLEKSQNDLAKELKTALNNLIEQEENEGNLEYIPRPLEMTLPKSKSANENDSSKRTKHARSSTIRLTILLAVLVCAHNGKYKKTPDAEDGNKITKLSQIDPNEAAKAMKSLFLKKFLEHCHIDHSHKSTKDNEDSEDKTIKDQKLVFTVSLNRPTMTSVRDSVPTTKADAARRLFHISSSKITWAVIDSGVDATHYAFKKTNAAQRENTKREEGFDNPIEDPKESRIEKKFDMTQVHNLRNRNLMNDEAERTRLAKEIDKYTDKLSLEEIKERLEQCRDNIFNNRPIDWDIVEKLVAVGFDKQPTSDHGTHVSGILAGNWAESKKIKRGEEPKVRWAEGMCPEISIYDFRVIAPTLQATEFAVIAALRLIRHINERNDFIIVHGANLSLSIRHDVTNYACGRTPVCEESEKLVESGVVVVAAAGNDGYNDFLTKKGVRPLHTGTSITDPGNAESVITVGATHRREPHNYGVSYFSSRGPTGDGRLKPDIVAPGEKIYAPVRNGEFAILEGTSMAAPHVSGAAAMLMARFPELIGQPRRIKQILCSTATDLGRERFYQGNGLVDVLRALQSV